MIHPILSKLLASIDELKEDPIKVINSSKGEPIAILDQNEPIFYCIPAHKYKSLIEDFNKLKTKLKTIEKPTHINGKKDLKSNNLNKNIIKFEPRRPASMNLEAIANILGCTVYDLLAIPKNLEAEKLKRKQEEELDKILEKKYEEHVYVELMPETVQVVDDFVQQKDENLTMKQYLHAIKRIYFHSLENNLTKVDRRFAGWYIDLLVE